MRDAVVRRAGKRDLEALSSLAVDTYVAAFGHTFSAADLAAHLARRLAPSAFAGILEDDVVLVTEAGEQLIGYVQFGTARDAPAAGPNDHALRRLYVRAAFQNQGIGTLLIDAALAHPRLRRAENVFLDVWEHNHAAQRLYRRCGFEAVGTRPFAVASGAATTLDVVMVRRASR